MRGPLLQRVRNGKEAAGGGARLVEPAQRHLAVVQVTEVATAPHPGRGFLDRRQTRLPGSCEGLQHLRHLGVVDAEAAKLPDPEGLVRSPSTARFCGCCCFAALGPGLQDSAAGPPRLPVVEEEGQEPSGCMSPKQCGDHVKLPSGAPVTGARGSGGHRAPARGARQHEHRHEAVLVHPGLIVSLSSSVHVGKELPTSLDVLLGVLHAGHDLQHEAARCLLSLGDGRVRWSAGGTGTLRVAVTFPIEVVPDRILKLGERLLIVSHLHDGEAPLLPAPRKPAAKPLRTADSEVVALGLHKPSEERLRGAAPADLLEDTADALPEEHPHQRDLLAKLLRSVVRALLGDTEYLCHRVDNLPRCAEGMRLAACKGVEPPGESVAPLGAEGALEEALRHPHGHACCCGRRRREAEQRAAERRVGRTVVAVELAQAGVVLLGAPRNVDRHPPDPGRG
mmetsp:Transcript_4114/g.9882  ORF Transcript_4114/g.9882 Transcript_4114/m.9882 type:complete len:451 (-) Transcript_4114:992-2344(-)